MRLLLDILQGAGLAGAAGLRPFLPALVAGAFASGDILVDFDGTAFAFLEAPGWLLAVVLALIATVIAQRRGLEGDPRYGAALSGLAIGIGALLFAGTLDDRHDLWWPGLLAGALCAALAAAAARSLLTGVRARLDAEAQTALPVYIEGCALLLAALSIVVPPVSVLALGLLASLLIRGRRREGAKYAGLRILR